MKQPHALFLFLFFCTQSYSQKITIDEKVVNGYIETAGEYYATNEFENSLKYAKDKKEQVTLVKKYLSLTERQENTFYEEFLKYIPIEESKLYIKSLKNRYEFLYSIKKSLYCQEKVPAFCYFRKLPPFFLLIFN